jgi:hypothetical protein
LANTDAEQVEETIQLPLKNIEMERVYVNKEAQRLKHCGLHPDAHVFLRMES